MSTHYLACDLGAESGRLMLGTIADDRLSIEEIHRFPNTPERIGESLCWNITRLWAELKDGLNKIWQRNLPISGISTASWGLDYLFLDQNHNVISPVYHYRDSRTALGVERVRTRVDWKTVFAETGIQFMPINTIYQLAAEDQERLRRAEQLLLIGDAFNFFLSGVARAEISLASTTQLYNPLHKAWSQRLMNDLEIPSRLFPAIVPSGTILGSVKTEWLPFEAQVIASCSHDTGAAVAGVPAEDEDWAYISSGTWSLLGVELSKPIITAQSRELNFTNEIGFGGTVRLLRNIVGLWIVQECRRDWADRGQLLDYAKLTEMAAQVPAFVSLIDPSDPRFVAPDDMPAKIAAYCRETNQPEPSNPAATVRCALESLALLYRRRLSEVEMLIGRRVQRLHIVGGGSKNTLLNQFTANATRRPVLAGPAEATAIGNLVVQVIALGQLPSLQAARDLVRRSFDVATFEPTDRDRWEEAYKRFTELCARA